jgi:hypothetical protein
VTVSRVDFESPQLIAKESTKKSTNPPHYVCYRTEHTRSFPFILVSEQGRGGTQKLSEIECHLSVPQEQMTIAAPILQQASLTRMQVAQEDSDNENEKQDCFEYGPVGPAVDQHDPIPVGRRHTEGQ